MKLPFKLRLSQLAIAGLLIATSIIVLMTRGHNHTLGQSQTNKQATAKSDEASAAGTANAAGSESAGDNKSSSADKKQSSAAGDNAKPGSAAPKASSLACDALTAGAAQKILSKQAASTKPSDMADISTTNTTLSTCAYADGNARIQVTVRTPNDNLGVSKNATEFGSGRPEGAVTVEGYGQSAFWDPDTHRLNILHSNIWYIVDLGDSGTQANTEAAAKHLAVKL